VQVLLLLVRARRAPHVRAARLAPAVHLAPAVGAGAVAIDHLNRLFHESRESIRRIIKARIS